MLRQVESLTSNKQGRQSVIVDRIGYDKEGHAVYTKLGNGTEATYIYDKQREYFLHQQIKNIKEELGDGDSAPSSR